jgi:hypothetical protein
MGGKVPQLPGLPYYHRLPPYCRSATFAAPVLDTFYVDKQCDVVLNACAHMKFNSLVMAVGANETCRNVI